MSTHDRLKQADFHQHGLLQYTQPRAPQHGIKLRPPCSSVLVAICHSAIHQFFIRTKIRCESVNFFSQRADGVGIANLLDGRATFQLLVRSNCKKLHEVISWIVVYGTRNTEPLNEDFFISFKKLEKGKFT